MIRFTTQSGSVYTVNDEAKTWQRPQNPHSPYVRTTEGEFLEHSPIIMGEPVYFVCPPLHPQATARLIMSTKVTSIEVI